MENNDIDASDVRDVIVVITQHGEEARFDLDDIRIAVEMETGATGQDRDVLSVGNAILSMHSANE